jgi:hypothetical protein
MIARKAILERLDQHFKEVYGKDEDKEEQSERAKKIGGSKRGSKKPYDRII